MLSSLLITRALAAGFFACLLVLLADRFMSSISLSLLFLQKSKVRLQAGPCSTSRDLLGIMRGSGMRSRLSLLVIPADSSLRHLLASQRVSPGAFSRSGRPFLAVILWGMVSAMRKAS